MAKKLNLSFKDNELENKLYDWLMKQSELTGASTYIKQLLLEDLNRKSTEKK